MYSLPFRLHVVLEPRRAAPGAVASSAHSPQPSSATLVLGVLLAVSESLPLTTRVKANGILDAFKLFVDSAAPAPAPAPASLALPSGGSPP